MNINENFHFLSQRRGPCLYLKLLYVTTIRLRRRSWADFLREHPDYETLQTVPQRLIWCRLQRDMTREELAAAVGVSLGTYRDLERDASLAIPRQLSVTLGNFFGKSPADFESPYSRFLSDGQGSRIKEIRTELGLSAVDYARKIGVTPCALRAWEAEQKVISYASWEKYFAKTA